MESGGVAALQAEEPATGARLPAFAGFGLELEYMLVDRPSLDVRPIADRVLQRLHDPAGPMVSDVERGPFGWSNELVLHLLELKNRQPTSDLGALGAGFQQQVRALLPYLAGFDARPMPGGMHPWMDPGRETRLWPHAGAEVYAAYDRVFDCRRHGWANLQAMHVNFPFASDSEFERLHTALRVVLPLVPAIAASSPFADGRATGWLDYRIAVYATNADRVPALTGAVIPDNHASRSQYEFGLLRPLYRAIAEHDPEGLLRHEWLNARGAIARFDRSAIELRLPDVQEHPAADVALAALLVDTVRWLYEAVAASAQAQQALATPRLADVLQCCSRDGERAVVDYTPLIALFGLPRDECVAGALWQHIGDVLARAGAAHLALWSGPLQRTLTHGTLARRLLAAAGPAPDRRRLEDVYRALCDCLDAGRDFVP